MNCNEEFVVRAVGKVTLEWPEINQLRLRDILYECLYNYNVLPVEQALVTSDIEEKMMIFIASKRLEGRSEKTLYNYRLILGKFASYVHKPISTVTVMDLRMYLGATTKNLKPGSINTIMSCFKSFFGWLELEEYIPKDPTRKLKPFKQPIRIRKSLTIDELEKLRDNCETVRERALLEFTFSTGARVSEIIGTDIEDLNFAENSLRVVGKGDKEREVYFSPKAKLYLEKYLDTRKDACPALFVSSRYPVHRIGTRAVEREIGKIAERAGFDKAVFPHLLRHTMATLAIQAGAKLTTVQHLLGHTDPSTTQIYAETSLEDVKHEYKQHLIQ
ncbi:site-specific tyrosine recombinase/integron integrase [Clostridium sp. BSD9I1]|uniref:site-specific tyrosine recombinase/integron integrase n=1 Tax=Clostridium sp. BSD9I1 TaxID=2003589 RepID=UPI001648CC31|nr:site-specific tyrosine recombinase/integron integrase [Clostridium sp. BSD9I1]